VYLIKQTLSFKGYCIIGIQDHLLEWVFVNGQILIWPTQPNLMLPNLTLLFFFSRPVCRPVQDVRGQHVLQNLRDDPGLRNSSQVIFIYKWLNVLILRHVYFLGNSNCSFVSLKI
jgi:hypothetical protein